LLLSGGIDSVVLLLKLMESGVAVRPVVVAQRYGMDFSALNEVVESRQIANLLGLRRRLLVADTDNDEVFGKGSRFGWHWCYPYLFAVGQFVKSLDKPCVIVTGAGDTLWGIRDTGYSLLDKRMLVHPVRHVREAWTRLLCSDIHLRQVARRHADCGISSAEVLNVALGQGPFKHPRRDIFRCFPELEETLTERVRQRVLGRLFPSGGCFDSAAKLMETFRTLRFYQYFGGRSHYDIPVAEPYIDALPWYSRTMLSVREALDGKQDPYSYFEKKMGKKYHSCISRINGDDYRRLPWVENKYLTAGLSELKSCHHAETATFDLTSSRWFQCDRFQELLRSVTSQDIRLLDLLKNGPVRRYYDRVIGQIRQGKCVYPRKTQPVRLVNFLRLEMFLRSIIE